MWQAFLQDNYTDRDEWLRYSDAYGLAERLGYESAEAAWDANPFIQGSVNSGDFSKADLVARYGKRMRRWDGDRLDREDACASVGKNSSEHERDWRTAIDNEKRRRGLTA
jgi:hypothetical protein